jgi:hypothetical protein
VYSKGLNYYALSVTSDNKVILLNESAEIKDMLRQIIEKLDVLTSLSKVKQKSLVPKGNKWSRLTKDQVREIFFSEKTVDELAKEFNKSKHCIYLIRRGASYMKWTSEFKMVICPKKP